MEKKIVVPIDYSDVSKDVVLLADEWAGRTSGKLYFLHVSRLPEVSYYPGHFEHIDQRDESKDLLQLEKYLLELKLKSEYELSHDFGTPYLKIVDLVESLAADLVIMAAHSHTMLGRLFLGSITDYVVHHVHCPIYICKKKPEQAKKIVLVPLDFSEANRPVVEQANAWAERTESELHFVHVMIPIDYSYYGAEASWGLGKAELELTEEQGLEAMDKFLDSMKITVPEKRVVLFGNSTYLRIMEYQKEVQSGILMLAGHDHTVAGRLFLGSNTDYLLHHIDVPMYVHKS
ncbi:MAG: universal stress protein [SAR324 cluster bacterium]|nr:universal stress protein [SAR324 cluster bacterium]MBL7034848.1 universal stress protein [SAR324 cluster bacterium]